MMTSAKLKKTIIFVIFWFLLGLSFIFFSGLIILKANGYQLNWRYWKLIKTGMIILDGEPQDVTIKINQKYLKGLPLKMANVSPGLYEITVSKDGYHVWQRNFEVAAGKAVTATNILLYLQPVQDAPAPADLKIQQVINEYQNRSAGLEIKNTEIYWQGNLVTRFDSQVLAATVYTDNHHLVFQLGNEIRVIDLDGANNILLFNLQSPEPTAITFRDNGRTLIFLDDGQIKAKIIR